MSEKPVIERLLFVYKADSGVLSAVIDNARKVLMIKGCALCRITHGIAGEKDEWKECKEEIGVPVDYIHRDEIPTYLQALTAGRLPCVVARVNGRYEFLLGPDVLERCKGSVADLKGRLYFYASARGLTFPEFRDKPTFQGG